MKCSPKNKHTEERKKNLKTKSCINWLIALTNVAIQTHAHSISSEQPEQEQEQRNKTQQNNSTTIQQKLKKNCNFIYLCSRYPLRSSWTWRLACCVFLQSLYTDHDYDHDDFVVDVAWKC